MENQYLDKTSATARRKMYEDGINLCGTAKVTLPSIAYVCTTLTGAGLMGNLGCMYLSSLNPGYERLEQYRQSDMQFLERLCKNAGLSLKATDRRLVIFDRGQFEQRAPVRTIRKGGGYIKYSLPFRKGEARYSSCRVSYTDPLTGRCIEGIAYSGEGGQRLEIKAKAQSSGEAQTIAKNQLKLHNTFSMTPKFTLPGDPLLLAGNTVELDKWGAFDGRYIINRAVHKVDKNGYTTQVQLRRT